RPRRSVPSFRLHNCRTESGGRVVPSRRRAGKSAEVVPSLLPVGANPSRTVSGPLPSSPDERLGATRPDRQMVARTCGTLVNSTLDSRGFSEVALLERVG